MPALPPQRPRVLRSRGSWLTAALAFLTLAAFVFVRGGAGESDGEGRALAPDVEVDARSSTLTGRAELDFEVVPPNVTTATGRWESDGARKARAAAKTPPEKTIVVGFEVTDAIHGRPLNARRASLEFELTRGDEQWSGRRLEHGQRYYDAISAFGHARMDSFWGADGFLYIELDPATPHGVHFAFELELTFAAETEGRLELLPRATYRAEGALSLTGASYQELPAVACRRIDAWAEGTVVAGPHITLDDARIELIELPASLEGESYTFGGDVLTEAIHTSDPPSASAPVQPDRTFSVPGPSRATLPCMRLRLVLADGRCFLTREIHQAFRGGMVLQLEFARTATGRLLFRGAPATGLARLHAEVGGARVGQVSLERDGSFTLGGVPHGAFDVVIESGRPGGELARFPLASLTRDVGAAKLDLGVIEVAGHAEVMELELVDRHGAPAAAHLRWRGRGGSGGVGLRAAEVHTLLLAPAVGYDMELVPSPQAAPIALAATPGWVRVVVGE